MKRSLSIVIGLILLAGLVWFVVAERDTPVSQPTNTQANTAAFNHLAPQSHSGRT